MIIVGGAEKNINIQVEKDIKQINKFRYLRKK